MHTVFRSIKRGNHRALEFQRLLLHDYEITPARYEMLFVIREGKFERISQSELRRQLGVTAATISRMVCGLEEQKLLERSPSLRDGREIEVRLTEKAIKLLKKIDRLLIEPGIVWIAVYTVLGIDGKNPGALKFHLDNLRTGFLEWCEFVWPWCPRTTHPDKFAKKPPPPFEWPLQREPEPAREPLENMQQCVSTVR